MKRFILLSVFALVGLFLTAGLSDSSVTKETPTYQVTIQGNDVITSAPVQSASVDYEHAETFILFSPELGSPEVKFIRAEEKPSNKYFSSIRPPPRYRCQKSERHINFS